MEVSQPSLGSPRSVKTERNSRFSFHSRQPALVHVDVVSDGLDVIAIAESAIGLPFGQNGGEMVIPAELCRVIVPDQFVHVIERARLFLAPVQDFLVAAALEYARLQVIVIHMQKLHARAVGALAEIGMQVFPEFA